MADNNESLVMRRPKRSTAGNRMEAALAEFRAEELGQDVEEDVDFVMEKDEQDAFGSDFESTDEEGDQEDVDASAEKMAREEERRVKKVARSQLDKVTAAANARHKATFHPDVAEDDDEKPTPVTKVKRRVSMGVVVDAETGAIVESTKRHSQRSHTRLNTSMTDSRIRDEMEKKSALPKRTKIKTRPPTQGELIARALDMEEGNIKEHRNYLKVEEEKRKRARLVRTAVEGPLLRWVSKTEQVTVKVEPLPPPPPVPQYYPPPQYSYSYSATSQLPAGYPQPPPFAAPSSPSGYYSSVPQYGVPPPTSPSSQMTFIHHQYSPTYGPSGSAPAWPQATPHQPMPPPPPPEPIERVETVNKNYVVHENSQDEDATRPLWKETMAAMFGDHVKWEDLKVYSGRSRPMSRPQETCPITGQKAKYRDPRTGVPYADIRAFQTLTKILSHEFVWSESLGCYVASNEDEARTTGAAGSSA